MNYFEQLDELRNKIEEDFNYYRKQNSAIDRRLNDLGRRGNVEAHAEEMRELLEQRAKVKDASLRMLPLRDLFRNNWTEVNERLNKTERYARS